MAKGHRRADLRLSVNMDALLGMGFSRSDAESALRQSGGKLDVAVDLLTSKKRSADDRAHEYAARCARDQEAAEALMALLAQLQLSPSDPKLKVIPTAGSGPLQRSLRSGGSELLGILGFAKRGAFLALSGHPQHLDTVVSTLQAQIAKKTEATAEARARSQVAKQARAQAAAVFAEPSSGARLTFVLKGIRTVRTFDGDDTLYRVIRFLASLDPSTTPPDFVADGALTWRIIDDHDPPYWWCDAWHLSDTTSGRDFSAEDAPKTITSLGLWPSAVVAIEPVNLGAIAAPTPHHVGSHVSRPQPSELKRQVEARFDNSPLQGGSERKQHFNVAKSVAATPGLAELLAMGFSEDQSRAALRRFPGDVQRALDSLLHSE